MYLTYFASDIPDDLPQFVASNNQCTPALGREPAGFSFHKAALRVLGFDKQPEVEEEVPEKKEKGTSSPSVDSYQFKGKKKSGDGADTQDHYALLGLSHLRFLATEDQIRKSYREAALKHHPDKQASVLLIEDTEEKKQVKKEEIDRHFKAIQLAYEVLIDPVKRRAYDSIDEFDDEVPSDCAPEDFYKIFGPVFARNGRWSTIQPVPLLGEDDIDVAIVDKFYDFWWAFKSWREFPHADEFDLEAAESREHKRWMERQNAKFREKAKKEENARIRLMTENAYKRDPRIIRRKEEEKAEKLRKKQAKVQAKRDKEEEAARLLEEERLRKEEEDKRAAEEASAQKKSKEKEKKLLRKEKARLRAVSAVLISIRESGVNDDAVETLCTTLEISLLRGLCEKLEGIDDTDAQAEYLRNVISGAETVSSSDSAAGTPSRASPSQSNPNVDTTPTKSDAGKGASESGKTPVHVEGKKPATVLNAAEKKEKPWNKEEVDLLRKAVVKYPKGTSQRWEVVSNYIGTNRSVEEILKAIKTVLMQKPDSSKAFDSFLQKRKTGSVVIDSPLSTREDGSDLTKSGEAPTSKVLANGNTQESSEKKVEKKRASEGEVDATSNGKKVENGTNSEEDSQRHAQSNGAVANGSVTELEGWSDVQEVALVKAIKAFPKDTPNRWDRIASSVAGKNKAQCFKKFAELRENFRTTKKA